MDCGETNRYLDSLPLVQALWWFIENVLDDDPVKNEVFFHLRDRYRGEQQSTTLGETK